MARNKHHCVRKLPAARGARPPGESPLPFTGFVLAFCVLLAESARAQDINPNPVFDSVNNLVFYSCTNEPAFFTVTAGQRGCTNVVVTCTPPSGTILAPGTTTNVVCVAAGCGGYIATTNFTVTMAWPPMHFQGATNQVLTSCTNVPVNFDVSATSDCCTGNAAVVCTPPSGTILAPGTWSNVVCVATDCNGHTDTNTFTVTVQAPVLLLSCVPDKTVRYDASWSFDRPTVQLGCCPDTSYTLLPTTPVTNLSGAFTVTESWLVTNSCGETAACSQTVTLDFSGSLGGVASANSGDFTIDTTGTLPGTVGVASADSGDFTIDTSGTLPGMSGVVSADSGDLMIDTTGARGAYADSGDFTLDTRGLVVLAFKLLAPLVLPNGTFHFSFTNTPGLSFSVFGHTNAAAPFSNWTFLGALTDNPPGQFQFTDLQRTNYLQRFYRVSSP